MKSRMIVVVAIVLCFGFVTWLGCGHGSIATPTGLEEGNGGAVEQTCTLDQFLGQWSGGDLSGGGCIDIILEEQDGVITGSAITEETRPDLPRSVIDNCQQVTECEYMCVLQSNDQSAECDTYDVSITFKLDPTKPDQMEVSAEGTVCGGTPIDDSVMITRGDNCAFYQDCTIDQFVGLWGGGEIYADDGGGGCLEITLEEQDGALRGTVEVMENNELQTAEIVNCTQVLPCKYLCDEEIEEGLPDCGMFDVEVTFILYAPEKMYISAKGTVCNDVLIDDSDTFNFNGDCGW